MTIPPNQFRAPYIPAATCWQQADDVRSQYSAGLPVDVLAMAEFDIGLELRTVPNLRQDADVDALLLGDWKTLVVDSRQLLDERNLPRLRFSIAHELGHFFLHKEAFSQIPRNSVDEWIEYMQSMPDREYGFIEYQAYEFGGRLLVPPEELAERFTKVISQAIGSGIPRERIGEEHLGYLCNPIARDFEVSNEVIQKRLQREKLWPL